MEAQPAPHALVHLGHGDRASRYRGEPRRHGIGQRVHPASLVATRVGEPQRCRAVHGDVRRDQARRRPRLFGAGGGVERFSAAMARRSFCAPQSRFFATPVTVTSESAISTRSTGSSIPCSASPTNRAMAASAMVEAVRDIDLGGRCADRDGRRAVAAGAWYGASGGRRCARRSTPGRRYGLLHEASDALGAARGVRGPVRGGFARLAQASRPDGAFGDDRQARPGFYAGTARAGQARLASTDLGKGKPRLLNVFASWCVPCIAEAPQLMALKQAGVEIDGVAVRDTGPAIADFLQRNGDPYAAIGDDPRRGAASLGVFGRAGNVRDRRRRARSQPDISAIFAPKRCRG